jgi:hypothetical protein
LKAFIQDTKDIALPRINTAGCKVIVLHSNKSRKTKRLLLADQVTSVIHKRILAGMMDKKIHEVLNCAFSAEKKKEETN